MNILSIRARAVIAAFSGDARRGIPLMPIPHFTSARTQSIFVVRWIYDYSETFPRSRLSHRNNEGVWGSGMVHSPGGVRGKAPKKEKDILNRDPPTPSVIPKRLFVTQGSGQRPGKRKTTYLPLISHKIPVCQMP
jgi:hypothetical protein